MDAKSVLYAAVGAPVVAARKVGERAGEMSTKLGEQATGYTETFEKKVDDWAVEGQKVIGKIGDQKVVEDITSRVDLDQAKDQVSKLRDQLEEMLATWRTSFRPEESGNGAPAAKSTAAPKAPAKTPAAKKPAAKKPAAKAASSKSTKTSAAKTTKSAAAKTSSAKTSAAAKAKKTS